MGKAPEFLIIVKLWKRLTGREWILFSAVAATLFVAGIWALLPFLLATVVSPTMFVQDGGSDSGNNCRSSGSPCLTLQQAENNAGPGDIIELRTAATGTRTYTQHTIFNSSGTSAEPILVCFRSGDTYDFHPTGAGSIFQFDNAHHWVINGSGCPSTSMIELGDQSEWSDANSGQGYAQDRNIRIQLGSSNIEIGNFQSYGGNDWVSNVTEEDTSHVYIHDATFSYVGTNDNGTTDRADCFDSQGQHHIFARVSFDHCGHSALRWHTVGGAVVDVTLDGDWTDEMTGSPGARVGEFQPAAIGSNGGQAPYGPNLFDGLIFTGVNSSVDESLNTATKFEGRRQILRNSFFYDNHGESIRLGQGNPVGSHDNAVEYQCLAHNTLYNSDDFIDFAFQSTALDGMQKHRIVNNVIQSYSIEQFFINWNATIYNQQGYPDDWFGATISGNVISGSPTIRMVTTGGDTVSSVASAESTWSDVWYDNQGATATFVNAAARTKAGLQLDTGSAGEDDAEPIATVTANSSGTTVAVDYSYCFFDGFGVRSDWLTSAGISKDWIAIYDPTFSTLRGIRQVTSVDSETQITVHSAVSVTDGDYIVYVLRDGTTPWRNAGAPNQ